MDFFEKHFNKIILIKKILIIESMENQENWKGKNLTWPITQTLLLFWGHYYYLVFL